jgi:hypothetical protein
MRKIKDLFLLVFAAPILFSSAYSQSGMPLDEEIGRLTGKIQQYPGRDSYLSELKETFDEANRLDKERIHSLLLSGQPDIWFDVFTSYKILEKRQETVKQLPERSIRQSGIEFTDYRKEMDEAEYRATAYLYAHGRKSLERGNPQDARQAYIELMKAASLMESYKDIDKLIRKSILKGATNMEFAMHNRTHKTISPAMIDQLSVIIWEFKKARYGQQKPETEDNSFAFIIRVILDDLQIGSDQVRELEYQEERDIYADGLVVDTIRCLVEETRQLKKAMLTGSLEYFDKQTGQVVNSIPIKVESVFQNAYATMQGNPDAAGDETRELLKAHPAEYPTDEQMILDATEEFARKASELILAE